MATPPEGGRGKPWNGEEHLIFAQMVRRVLSEEREDINSHQKAWETLAPTQDEETWTHSHWRMDQTTYLLQHAGERHGGVKLGNPPQHGNAQEIPTEGVKRVEEGLGKAKSN